MSTSLIPESAPFNDEQRAWLNGFFAGLIGLADSNGDAALGIATDAPTSEEAGGEETEEDFPWHDPSLEIGERMEMAEGKPLERRLMAAMAQLDCGSCGYLCKTYSEAIASGEESNLTLCSPGGKETAKLVKLVVKKEKTKEGNGSDNATVAPAASNGANSSGAEKEPAEGTSRLRPLTAVLLESRRLNLPGSAKDTRHVAIDLADSGLTYQVGDALGVYPANCGQLVDRIIKHLGADAALPLKNSKGLSKSLWAMLSEDCCLRDPSDELLELLRDRCSDRQVRSAIDALLDNGVDEGFDVLDALELAPSVTLSATEMMEQLDPLNPRLYSIASSQRKVGNQVHLTIGTVRYELRGRQRTGVASTMFSDRLQVNDTVRVFVQKNHGGFTVPADPAVPMIMVGPGTGIAPFLAFLQEREAAGKSGPNWLFFGDQHEASDFLYRDELQAYREGGLLDHLDTAFSRDGQQKVYVQDRMRQRAGELWQWLERGAHFYVCGDASRMAQDVDRALHDIIVEAGAKSSEEAAAYVQQMTAENRYARDVY